MKLKLLKEHKVGDGGRGRRGGEGERGVGGEGGEGSPHLITHPLKPSGDKKLSQESKIINLFLP